MEPKKVRNKTTVHAQDSFVVVNYLRIAKSSSIRSTLGNAETLRLMKLLLIIILLEFIYTAVVVVVLVVDHNNTK